MLALLMDFSQNTTLQNDFHKVYVSLLKFRISFLASMAKEFEINVSCKHLIFS